jgi:hypothetical protein
VKVSESKKEVEMIDRSVKNFDFAMEAKEKEAKVALLKRS